MVEILSRSTNAGIGLAMALRQLWSLTMRETLTQTYADAFLALMACLAVAAVLVCR